MDNVRDLANVMFLSHLEGDKVVKSTAVTYGFRDVPKDEVFEQGDLITSFGVPCKVMVSGWNMDETVQTLILVAYVSEDSDYNALVEHFINEGATVEEAFGKLEELMQMYGTKNG